MSRMTVTSGWILVGILILFVILESNDVCIKPNSKKYKGKKMIVLVNKASGIWFVVDSSTGEYSMVKKSCRTLVDKFNRGGLLEFNNLKEITKVRNDFEKLKYKDIKEEDILISLKKEYAEMFI